MPIYYKVYQDKENTDGNSYIIPLSKVEITSAMDLECVEDGTLEHPCVFEPVEMTEEEYESLPEFKGY